MNVEALTGRGANLRVLCSVVFLAALLIRIAGTFVIGYNYPPESEAVNIAKNLAERNAFANPYPLAETGPTSHAPPGFVFVLSLVYRVTEPGAGRELASAIVSSIVAAAAYGLLPWLAGRLGLPMLAGFIGGLAGAALPLFLWVEARGYHDSPWVALWFVIVLGVIAALRSAHRVRDYALAGFICGLAFLFAPSLLPTVLGALCVVAAYSWRVRGIGLHRWAVFGLLTAATVAPWIIRNYVQFGSVFWIRGNFGLELHFGNNDRASPLMVENTQTSADLHPFARRKQVMRILEVGETEFFREHKRAGYDWIRNHFAEYLRLCGHRFVNFWFLPLNHWGKRLLLVTLTLAGLGGTLWMLMGKCRYAGLLLGSALLFYPAVYYFVVPPDARYREPLHPIVLLAAGFVLEKLAAQVFTGRRAFQAQPSPSARP